MTRGPLHQQNSWKISRYRWHERSHLHDIAIQTSNESTRDLTCRGACLGYWDPSFRVLNAKRQTRICAGGDLEILWLHDKGETHRMDADIRISRKFQLERILTLSLQYLEKDIDRHAG